MELTEFEKEEIKKVRREYNREYKKEWRKNNPDKIKAANERYWLKVAAKKRAEKEGRKDEE